MERSQSGRSQPFIRVTQSPGAVWGGFRRDWKGQQLAADPPVIRPLSEQKLPHVGCLPAV